MGYATNPFNSNAGKKILKENFRLIFAPSTKNPKDIEAENLREITGHFVDHTEQIVNNIMKFSKGHKPIPPANAYETGIYVCPHCLRRDFMNLWEFEYLGYFQPGSLGNESLKFKKSGGRGYKKDTYATLARVKCNTVYSCTSCHTTHVSKPQYDRCQRCSGEDMRPVGCGKVSYAEHYTPSLDVEQLYSNPQQTGSVTVNANEHRAFANFGPTKLTPKPVVVHPTAFEYSKNDSNLARRSDYTYRDDYEDWNADIPSLNVAYSSKKLLVPNSSGSPATPKVQKFPISPMRLFRWKAPFRFICNNRSHWDYSDGSRWGAQFKLGKDLGTSYWCTSVGPYGRQHGKRWAKKLRALDDSMTPTITSPNPLPPDSVQPRAFQGAPIYRITIEMRPREHQDETFQYSLYLPSKFSLQRFMEDVTDIPLNQGGREFCPNDPIIEEALTKIDCDQLNTKDQFSPRARVDKKITIQDLIDAKRTDVVDLLTKYASGIVTGPKGSFSQISLEGCSERGVLMGEKYRGWVDYSSEVLNAAGEVVPRYLFVNKKEKVAREWLAEYCKKLNEFGKGSYTFMNFARTRGSYSSYSGGSSSSVDHKFPASFLAKANLEEQLLTVLAGTPSSISTFSGNQSVFSKEFWRKLRGVKLKSDSRKIFDPIVTDGNTSFLPTYLVSRMRLPVCTLNGQVNKIVQGQQKKLRATHLVETGIAYIDEQMMTVYTVVRCVTCNDIYDSAGVMNYRSAQGWVNSTTGKVTGSPPFYTQEAFDDELAHEKAAGTEWVPFTTSDGFRVCPNWGIDQAPKYGKAMLKGGSQISMDVKVRKGKKGKK